MPHYTCKYGQSAFPSHLPIQISVVLLLAKRNKNECLSPLLEGPIKDYSPKEDI